RNDRKGNRRTNRVRERQPSRPIKIEHGISCRGNEGAVQKVGQPKITCHSPKGSGEISSKVGNP
uniref:hypothetical protein n=1 Tax=Parabacteroides merdae TaxID=46503 RepID=UPI004025BB8C